MSCCGNNNNGNVKKNSRLMKLCCILPIVLISIMFVVNSFNGISGNLLTYSLLLLCPISHLVLMPLMMRKKNLK